MAVNDTSIIALFQRRSEAALSELMRQYGRLLRQLAWNILPTEEDAEECVNDAVLDVWNSIPPQQPRSLSAYACSLVRNRALDRRRYLTAEKRGGAAEAEAELDALSGGDAIGDYLDAREVRQILQEFLSSLTPENRILFVKRYYFCKSVTAIANELSMSENAVSVRLSRLRAKLGRLLEEREVSL